MQGGVVHTRLWSTFNCIRCGSLNLPTPSGWLKMTQTIIRIQPESTTTNSETEEREQPALALYHWYRFGLV